MFLKFFPRLILLFLIVGTSCKKDKPIKTQSDFPKLKSFGVEDSENLIIEKTTILGQPLYITLFDSNSFLVYDSGIGKYLQFDLDGKKLNEFGKAGRGPGEFDQFSGLSNLKKIQENILGVSYSQYKINKYTIDGDFLESFEIEKNMKFNDVEFIDDKLFLQATHGLENSLVLVRHLETGEIVKKIGTPQGEPADILSLEEQRLTYEKGNIPLSQLNTALIEKLDNGYLIFLNGLGELQFYSDQGKLLKTSFFPDSIKNPIKELVFNTNKTGRPGRVMNLSYASQMKIFNEKIFLFIPDFDVDGKAFYPRLIVSDLNGNFTDYMKFEVDENSFYFDFTVSPDGTIYFVDAGKSEIKYY